MTDLPRTLAEALDRTRYAAFRAAELAPGADPMDFDTTAAAAASAAEAVEAAARLVPGTLEAVDTLHQETADAIDAAAVNEALDAIEEAAARLEAEAIAAVPAAVVGLAHAVLAALPALNTFDDRSDPDGQALADALDLSARITGLAANPTCAASAILILATITAGIAATAATEDITAAQYLATVADAAILELGTPHDH